MLELNTHERVAVRKASTAYGDEFLIDNSPTMGSYLGGWASIDIPGRQFSTVGITNMPFSSTAAVNEARNHEFFSRLPEREGALTQTNLLDAEEDQVQELIFRIRRFSPSISYCQSLADRLVTLFNDAKEENCVSPGISVGSLRNFFIFLQSYTNLKHPTISLTPEYNIYASWRAEPNRVFSVHFLPNGDARFVIFKPNDKHPERQIRLSGIATTDILMDTLAPYGVSDWILEFGSTLRAA
jgi:hypothetical protein